MTAATDAHRATDVLCVEDVWGSAFDALAARHTVVREPDAWSDGARLRQLCASARTLVVRNRTSVDRDLLEAAPSLEAVARAGSGLDNIDLAAAAARGVAVIAATAVNARSVAEHTLGLALTLARGIAAHDHQLRTGVWQRRPGVELRGLTWGLLGLGATGLEVAALARCLGMTTVAHDPYVDPADQRVRDVVDRMATVQDLTSGADVVSVHLPLTARTRGSVDARLLRSMRPTAFLINVARGEVVDEDDLVQCLEEGAIAGAALDVRSEEPATPGRLEKLEKVVLTPHIAGLTTASQERICTVLAEDLARVLDGAAPRHAVKPPATR